MTKIRVRYPDRVRYDREHLGHLPISLATAHPSIRRARPRRQPGIGFVPLGQLASIRTSSAARTSSGARTSSRSSP